MKIADKYKVRELAGEHVVVVQGSYGADMTRIVSLNASALYLWEALRGREFDIDEIVRLLPAHYDVDEATARRDAEAWAGRLAACGVLENR